MNPKLAKLIAWIEETAKPARGLLIPISGGSDSALVFWLLNQAWSEKTVGVYAGTDLRCRQWFESTGTVRLVTDIPKGDDKEAMRWATFLSIMRREGHWLVGARNRTEDLLGTYSLASRVATYLPLAGVWKTEVMELCADIGVPSEIIDSSRQADPDCGRPVEMAEIELALIDTFLRVREGELNEEALAALVPAQVEYLDHVLSVNRFKRFLPVTGPTLAE